MNEEFKLRIIKMRKSLVQGDISKIALKAGVSVVSVQKMFKVQEFNELKPAMKLALDAAINFTRQKKISNARELENIMGI